MEYSIKVLILTTSFPTIKKPLNGVFVKKYVDNLPKSIEPVVLAPASNIDNDCDIDADYQYYGYRYAPRALRILAQSAGGIPNAIKTNPALIIIVPMFLSVMFIKTILLARRVKVIHANWSINGVVGCVVGKLLNKPVITTFRGADLNSAATSKFMRALIKICMAMSEFVTVVSMDMKAKLLSEYPKKKR